MKTKANNPEELMEWIAAGAKPKSVAPVVSSECVMPLLEQLYCEAQTEKLRESLLDDGVETLEDAYVKGFHHALAELKMRIEEKRHNGLPEPSRQ